MCRQGNSRDYLILVGRVGSDSEVTSTIFSDDRNGPLGLEGKMFLGPKEIFVVLLWVIFSSGNGNLNKTIAKAEILQVLDFEPVDRTEEIRLLYRENHLSGR